MATKKNTRKSTSNANPTTSNDPLGEENAVMKRIDALFQLDTQTWTDLDTFVAEQGPAITKDYELEEGDIDGGLGIAFWIASLVKDTERAQQSQVDAAIEYLDPSASA